jgi:ATP-dependent Clp protease adaptor protein ClpS
MESIMAVDTEVTSDVVLDEKVKIRVSEPKRYHVVFLNDNHTPMEFVISILIEIFKHTPETAKDITLQIHESGSGIAGTYTYEIAEVKSSETFSLARANGFPLQVKMEEE